MFFSRLFRRKNFEPRGDYDIAYPRPEEWERFVEFHCKERWEPNCQNKQEIIDAVNGDEEIAIALYAVGHDEALECIHRDGGESLCYLSPKECLEYGLRGRLQSALISYPYI